MKLTLLLPYDPLPPAPAYTVRILRQYRISAYDLLEAALALRQPPWEHYDCTERMLHIFDYFRAWLPAHIDFAEGMRIADAIDKALTPIEQSLLPIVVEHIEKQFGHYGLRCRADGRLFPDYFLEIELTEPTHEDIPAFADHLTHR